MRNLRVVFLLIAALWLTIPALAQIEDPVSWAFSSEPGAKSDEVKVIFKATIDGHWHLYSQFIEEGGPIPTSFTFEGSDDFELVGEVKEESKIIEGFDPTFEMNIGWFEHEAVFSQIVKLKKPNATVSGYLTYMVCNDKQCLPPTDEEFAIEVKGSIAKKEPAKPKEVAVKEKVEKTAEPEVKEVAEEAVEETPVAEESEELAAETVTEEKTIEVAEEKTESKEVLAKSTEGEGESKDKRSMWAIFLAGFLGGFAALIMPCIFPMLPLTVSYFTKQGGKGSAVGKALFYGLSIIVIYVGLGLVITVIFGADALNALSTNGIFNFAFFVLLVVFAASFFGAFEITLPSSWGNKMDSKADKGGLVGIFFMAATLALVSFSCTGPIIGTLLVQAASMGQLMGPAVGMFGFALSLSIPFALFAMFPSWLNALPKSGGWLNSVKVVLGFLELALALKFLSNVDLAYHWEWFDREVFLVLWIVIFALMGMYLLGKIKFSHDSELKFLSFPRLTLAIISFAFAMYLIPGMWGAPLKVVAAFLPPQHTQDFDLYTSSFGASPAHASNESKPKRKYSEIFHAPLNLEPFFDYEEGVAYAKKVNKPIMIDFTGHACVNCRKMEATIWPDPKVLGLIRDEYVLIQLYVDDRTELAEEEWYVSEYSGKKVRTIGKKWSDLQASRFNANSQPYYVLLSPEEELLTQPQGAIYDVEAYTDYLKLGLKK